MARQSSCKHLNRRNIFGDEAIRTISRQRCTDCGKVVKDKSADPKGLRGELFQDTDTLLEMIDECLNEEVYLGNDDDGTFER